MNTRRRLVALAAALHLALPAPLPAEEAVDLEIATRIRQEALSNSQVMNLARALTEDFGPRLTASPELAKASAWAKDTLASWGLQNAQLEAWGPFGEGWTLERAVAHQTKPWAAPLTIVPRAWAPGTNGPVRGPVVVAKLESEEDLAQNKGKLGGKIVLMGELAPVPLGDKPALSRYTDAELEELERFEQGGRGRDPARRALAARRYALRRKLIAFLDDEKVLAVLDPSGTGGQVATMSTRPRDKDEAAGVPWLHVRAEQWNRLARLSQAGREVEVEVDVKVAFHAGDGMAHNVLADLPGSDKRGELVMIGAHIDSWHAATGAADNAAGVAVAMEAMRILKSLGATPRRTIRVGLWSGEEQGLLGARAHVAKHFASRPPAPDSQRDTAPWLRRPTGPLTVHAGHGLLSAYFNLDNGTGRIRGIYAQQNVAASRLFRQWLEPYRDLGATTVTLRDTGSTDHVPFDEVGLPGFQFIQDDVEYESRTHHRNLDDYDRLQEADLKQAAAVMAGFAWQAATRPERLPRKPMPKDEPAAARPAPAAR